MPTRQLIIHQAYVEPSFVVSPGLDPAPLEDFLKEVKSLEEGEQPYPEMQININEKGLNLKYLQYCPVNVRGERCSGSPDGKLGIPNFCTKTRFCWTWLRDNPTGRANFAAHPLIFW